MITETDFQTQFLDVLQRLSDEYDSSRSERQSAGAADEAVLERIRFNVVDIFKRMFLLSFDDGQLARMKMPGIQTIAAQNPDRKSRMFKIYEHLLEVIPSNWVEGLRLAEIHDDVCGAVKERVKLEVRDRIRLEFERAYREYSGGGERMTVIDTIKLMKALADRSRLMIMNTLMERPQYVEELSERLDLSASTVSFHLRKLEEAGLVLPVKEQYYVVYHLKDDLLSMTMRDMIRMVKTERKDQDERMAVYRRKILSTFIKYGRLVKIPVQRKKRRVILEEIARKFSLGRRYSEKEVNLIIAEFNDDFCTLRREMICENIMNREKGFYWLTGEPASED